LNAGSPQACDSCTNAARICVKAEDQICAGLLERFDFIGPGCDRCDLPVLISLAQSTDACNIESDLSCRQ
jgi:hypothetical protein